jgi:glycosyltransferase involved in cell wall biosynthesis
MNSALRLGVIVGENDPWRFFEDVYADLQAHWRVDLFRVRRVRSPFLYYRLNRAVLLRDLNAFMQQHDIVFFEWASELLVAASHLPKRCRIIVRVHRYEMFEWIAKVNWAVVDKVIFVSQAMRQKFIAQFPDQQSKTVVIPVGIALDKFQVHHAARGSGNIGTMCFISPRKRVYELILTFYELLQKKPGLYLHIGGGTEPAYADYTDAMQHLVRELKLQNQVTFHGAITDAAEWYRNLDVFVSNSYSEGLQVALMEAMAYGCYCVAHRWEGVDELLPDEYLVFTDSELRENILRYLELPPTCQAQHQEKMRQIARAKCDGQVTKIQIRQVIQEVGATL